MVLEFPDIHPVAFYLGPFPVRWYALAYMAGFLAAWQYCLKMAHADKRRPNRADIDMFLSWAVIGVIFGGRVGYVLFYQWEYYATYPGEIIKVWRGGMAFHGGMLGVIFALLLFSWLKNIPLLRLSDLLACAVPIGLFFGRIANFVNGELYGRVSDAPWAMVFPNGGTEPRHPSQLYEAGLEGLALFCILYIASCFHGVRERPGILAGLFLSGYGIFRAFIENFREPDEQIGFVFEYLTMGQVLCIPMVVLGLGLIVYALSVGYTGPIIKTEDDETSQSDGKEKLSKQDQANGAAS